MTLLHYNRYVLAEKIRRGDDSFEELYNVKKHGSEKNARIKVNEYLDEFVKYKNCVCSICKIELYYKDIQKVSFIVIGKNTILCNDCHKKRCSCSDCGSIYVKFTKINNKRICKECFLEKALSESKKAWSECKKYKYKSRSVSSFGVS